MPVISIESGDVWGDIRSTINENFDEVSIGGTDVESFWVTPTTATGWNEVSLPSGVYSKAFFIQVHGGDPAAELSADAIKFLFSSNSDGTGWTSHTGGFVVSLSVDSNTIGYVYTGSIDVTIAVQVLER